MLCDECKKNPATIHYTQVVGGVSHEMHLCAACMKKRKGGFDLGDMQGLLSSLLSGMESSGEESAEERAPEVKTLRCSRCGMEFARFRKTGMLGCAQCYQDFRGQLAPILKRIHGRVQHAGHVPPSVNHAQRVREETERLKAEMNEAVLQENFERAAQLRDQIRALAAQEKAREQQEAAAHSLTVMEKSKPSGETGPQDQQKKEAADDAQ